MKKRLAASFWSRGMASSLKAMTRIARSTGRSLLKPTARPAAAKSLRGQGSSLPGVALGVAGALRFRLFRPPGVRPGEKLPLMVMLHGCGQDADGFAASTRMNRLALRERFLVLYPEQDRLANGQGCWNWFDTDHGRAQAEAGRILQAINQVLRLQPADRRRVAIAGLSAGASMAALLASRHPERFAAVVMHSGIAPGTAHSTMTALAAMRGHRSTPPLPGTAGPWPALLVVQGDGDGVVAPSNAGAAALCWAQALGAQAGSPRRVQRGQRHPMSVTDFERDGEPVVSLVLVAGLDHAWSGGAASLPYGDAHGPDATRMAWAFARRQFERQTAAPARALTRSR